MIGTVRRNRTTLLVVAALFLGTPVVAWFAFEYTGLGRGGPTVNKGTLVEPPIVLAQTVYAGVAGPVELRGRWDLVIVAGAAGCDADCATDLVMTRQLRLSFGRDSERIARVLVSPRAADAVDPAQPDLAVLDPHDASVGALVGRLRAASAAAGVYVIDPLGNLMMWYAPGTPPADLKADLGRLLRLSASWMERR